jgi:hypothetical protein
MIYAEFVARLVAWLSPKPRYPAGEMASRGCPPPIVATHRSVGASAIWPRLVPWGAAAIALAACSAFWASRLAHSAASSAIAGSATHRNEARALVALGARTHPAGMFVVTEAEAAAIRAAFEQRGEFSAAVELRRLFPGVTDTAQARACARTIAGWKPLPVSPSSVTRGRPRRRDPTPPA